MFGVLEGHGIYLSGLELARREKWRPEDVGLRMESASVRWTRKSGPPEHVGRASDAEGPRAVEDAGVNHGRFTSL
jgi:hypothetical protein